jgi:23S rRNA (cytosine1962-C5)-methyltransferase
VKRLTVGRESAGFVSRGHPWIRPDRFTRGLDRLRPGELCELADEHGRTIALALAEPGAAVCARVVARAGAAWDPAAAAHAAWERRAALHADPDTDCWRVVHGEADALPGLRVERFGRCLSATITAACILPWLDRILAALAERLPDARIVVHEHLADLRRAGVQTRAWPRGAIDPAAIHPGRELGVDYPLRPEAGIAAGLYVDQRANRAWLRPRCANARVLNLFAYTGAFSLSLLAGGAAEAVDVDLSQPALARAAETATLNRLAGHRIVRADARTFCREEHGRFGIVVIDPPTSAQGGDGWVARRDWPGLLALAWPLVAPGGLLLASSNTVGRPFPLRETLAAACPGGRPLATPRFAVDVPQLAGFPEGAPFRAAAMERPG